MWFAPEGVTPKYQYGYNHTEWFQYWKAEHEAVRDDLGVVDLSPFCKILVEGEGAEALLQWLCTNDVSGESGRVVYTQWLNERAGIEADLTVAKLAENRFLVMTSVVTGLAELKYLRDEAKGNSQVTITDISSSQAVFGLSGPRTR
jgi:4-methylaminobutanoate oxidase (formaldehyde-forming)